jgi:hypothetical protein
VIQETLDAGRTSLRTWAVLEGLYSGFHSIFCRHASHHPCLFHQERRNLIHLTSTTGQVKTNAKESSGIAQRKRSNHILVEILPPSTTRAMLPLLTLLLQTPERWLHISSDSSRRSLDLSQLFLSLSINGQRFHFQNQRLRNTLMLWVMAFNVLSGTGFRLSTPKKRAV